VKQRKDEKRRDVMAHIHELCHAIEALYLECVDYGTISEQGSTAIL
jgi:hypothetical protein